MIFSCNKCRKTPMEPPCIIITDDGVDFPEYCPWSGTMGDCDWNVMVEKHE